MAKQSTYAARVERLAKKLGSQRAVARALRITPSTLNHRLKEPDSVRYEHALALDGLEAKLKEEK